MTAPAPAPNPAQPWAGGAQAPPATLQHLPAPRRDHRPPAPAPPPPPRPLPLPHPPPPPRPAKRRTPTEPTHPSPRAARAPAPHPADPAQGRTEQPERAFHLVAAPDRHD